MHFSNLGDMLKVYPILCDSAHCDVVVFEIQTFEISECEYLTNGISFFVQMTLNARGQGDGPIFN